MKILSVGNSFSVDAQAWAHEIAKAGGEDILFGNLYIGGCSLERHMENVISGKPAYEYFRNNEKKGIASIETGLLDEEWDYITIQQASHFSGLYETYEPYLKPLTDYIREKAPKAEIVVHETWAYEKTSTHTGFESYGCDQAKMHEMLSDAYGKAASEIGARMIPVGEAVRLVREYAEFNPESGGKPITRDGFHLSLLHGRYLAGAVWYEFFTGKDIRENAFVPQVFEYCGKDEVSGKDKLVPIDEYTPSDEEMKILKECAHRAVKG